MAVRIGTTLLGLGVRPNVIIETGRQALSSLESLASKSKIPYERKTGQQLDQRLDTLKEDSLFLSVNNNYIFPSELCKCKSLRIVNFHNSLLPKYPGRNIATWAIFNNEKSHGVTWHLVDNGIDTGNIIAQERFPVAPETTALALTDKSIRVGIDLFSRQWEQVLDPNHSGMPQSGADRLFRSWEVPLNGFFPLDGDYALCTRFLRSFDYGPMQVLANPRLRWRGKTYSITKYSLAEEAKLPICSRVTPMGNNLWEATIGFSDGRIKLLLSEEDQHEQTFGTSEFAAS